MILPFEPHICVALAENSGFGITLKGDYQVTASDDEIIYTPSSPDDCIEIKGIQIGREFHWQRNQTQQFHGSIIIRRNKDGESILLNRIAAEEYLCSVISSEMNPDAPPEFLAAHAIISRTWLFNKIHSRKTDTSGLVSGKENFNDRIIDWTDTESHTGFDVCSDDHCQRYQGIGPINENARKAVELTRGIILMTSDGAIADARFSKCCGGKTEIFSSCWQNTDYSYLQPVECQYCNCEQLSEEQKQRLLHSILKDYDLETDNFYHWQTVVSASDIKKNLSEKFSRDIGEIESLVPLKRGASGRIVELMINGSEGTLTIGKELMIRRLLSPSHLYSSNFKITTDSKRNFLLDGYGWGHGVGLCQIGAAVMASLGKDHKDIISHYYPGTTLTKIYD